ncbi:13160_t:CDS:1 [Acaulospora colombiana]|uniref:13160_t:CDS:1 n=1 Tax=Acaulospora colombiana TaxID=27376 RepID=A0ACA9L1C3_9GLOM|nr:13160_t:CDS:1 [Acaulospora colombiana]
MTYVVTADVEIVRVIEGMNSKSTPSNSESLKSYLRTSGTHAQPTQVHGESYGQNKSNEFTEGLSFLRWANMIKDSRMREFEPNELEEIVEGPSETTNLDLEKGNRDSNISGKSVLHEHDVE